jgi:hypothetical protein
MHGRIILFVIAIATIALGAYCIVDALLWSDRPINFIIAGLILGTVGCYITWPDVIGLKSE